MALTAEDIKKIAYLARLQVVDQEIPLHLKNLSNILELIEHMNSVSTENITPMAHPIPSNQPLRADIVTESNQRQLFQNIAPSVESGLYLVPQVIE